MRISRLTVDKLGVKLYDRVSAVLAELVANSYDADSTGVEITAPVGEYLATRVQSRLVDKGLHIVVADDGIGMTPEEVNEFYLVVGAERRKDRRRGDLSKIYGRKVMGRKGVGKLAPFGICNRIEILTSGGALVDGVDEGGKASTGYLTAHLTLDRNDVLSDTDEEYNPTPGALDGIVRSSTGTTITLSGFEYRQVPSMGDLTRQLSQRFGIQSSDWKIRLSDSQTTDDAPEHERIVSSFDIETMPNTVINLNPEGVFGPDNRKIDLTSGFEVEGRFYSVTGWIGYSKIPYKDDLMAGVRIYCRGKIAAQTAVFGRSAGFTGEYDVRSYLVGELDADWLDEEEDLIQTDRRDILWSHEVGREFERWGQRLVLAVGRSAREPLKVSIWDQFIDETDIDRVLMQRFPLPEQEPIRANARELAKLMIENSRREEMLDPDIQDSVIGLSVLMGPHLTLDQTLREAAKKGSTISVVTSVLRTARVAELSSFGRIADNRVQVIKLLETNRQSAETRESVYQNLISEAPWLINPQWSPVVSNRSFSTLRGELERFISAKTGESVTLGEFSDPTRRADFVLHNHDSRLELIEIKPPGYVFGNKEMERLDRYYQLMAEFLADPANRDFEASFPEFHMILVCDQTSLSGVSKTSFEKLIETGVLSHISWAVFLMRTKQMHREFLEEAERQRLYAVPANSVE